MGSTPAPTATRRSSTPRSLTTMSSARRPGPARAGRAVEGGSAFARRAAGRERLADDARRHGDRQHGGGVKGGTGTGNAAGGDARGAGAYLSGAATITGSTFAANATISGGTNSDGSGGGLAVNGSLTVPITIADSTITANTADGPSGSSFHGYGGGLAIASPIKLASDTIDANQAPQGLGGNIGASATVHVEDTIVAGGVGSAGSQNCDGTLTDLAPGHNLEDNGSSRSAGCRLPPRRPDVFWDRRCGGRVGDERWPDADAGAGPDQPRSRGRGSVRGSRRRAAIRYCSSISAATSRRDLRHRRVPDPDAGQHRPAHHHRDGHGRFGRDLR